MLTFRLRCKDMKIKKTFRNNLNETAIIEFEV